MKDRYGRIAQSLIAWFEKNKRDLPFRRTKDPYQIWISEIMAQQTRIAALIPYFERFTKQFPTVEALAAAEEEEVLKAWQGLGYYARARNLHKAAQKMGRNAAERCRRTRSSCARCRGSGPIPQVRCFPLRMDKRSRPWTAMPHGFLRG